MNEATFKIGDEVKRTDYSDPKIYTIDKIREWRGDWIYSMVGQTYADGWCWVAEWNINGVDVKCHTK